MMVLEMRLMINLILYIVSLHIVRKMLRGIRGDLIPTNLFSAHLEKFSKLLLTVEKILKVILNMKLIF